MIIDGFDYGDGYTRAITYTKDIERMNAGVPENHYGRWYLFNVGRSSFNWWIAKGIKYFRRPLTQSEKENGVEMVSIPKSELENILKERWDIEYRIAQMISGLCNSNENEDSKELTFQRMKAKLKNYDRQVKEIKQILSENKNYENACKDINSILNSVYIESWKE